GLVINLYDYGFNQVVVQRYFAARSLRDCMKGILGNALLVVPISVPLYAIGIGLVAHYGQNPAQFQALLDSHPGPANKALDYAFPQFIATTVPAGLAGLIIAGVFAATISCGDAGINSLATISVIDFYKRFGRPGEKPADYVHVARLASVCWGLAAT